MKRTQLLGGVLALAGLLGLAAILGAGNRIGQAPLGPGELLSVVDGVHAGASTTAGGAVLSLGQPTVGVSSGGGVRLHTGTLAVIPAYLPPTAPTGLTAHATSGFTIDLAWTDNATTEDGFVIERKPEGGAFGYLDTVGADTESYTDTPCATYTTYTYRVCAVTGPVQSGWTNIAWSTSWMPGDANGDAVCDTADYFAMAAAWFDPGTWADGDFTGDGIVDTADYFLLSGNWYDTAVYDEGVGP